MPRVKGGAPGYPRYFSTVQSWGRSAGVYRRRMGTPEIVVKRACPCSSRFTPVGAPIGRSGFFSSVGASVFSAHCFSSGEGWRFSKTSATGLSATCGLVGFFSGIRTPVFCCDDREGRASGQGERLRLERPVGKRPKNSHAEDAEIETINWKDSCAKVPRPWRISTKRSRHGRGEAGGLRGHRGIQGGRSSCRRKSSEGAERY